MAFNIQGWGRLSSSANNTITQLQDGTSVGAPNYFTYKSDEDTVATIQAAGYFNQVEHEVNVGDRIYAIGTDGETDETVTGV